MGLFKRKKLEIFAPVSGKCIPISDVNDTVFASKMIGDGVAFVFTENLIYAPCDGRIALIADSLHAVGITMDNGAEILIHIGLDTVALNGEGFKKLVSQGDKVKKGTPIIEVNQLFMKERNIDLTTPMVITNGKQYNFQINIENNVKMGNTILITFQ